MNTNFNYLNNGIEKPKVAYPVFQINLSSLATLFTVLFVGLKLGHIIDWSWIWVISPLWLPFVLFLFAWGIIWLFGWLLLRKRR